ncbi:hypothetical protein Tco_0782150 [Tanacetum coccineum]
MAALKFASSHNMVQFWATAKVKTVNGEVQIQAQVDKTKVIITKASIRRDLQLANENGTECLPNATNFAELEKIGAKTTVWNEFSSTIASAVILFMDKQVEGISKHKEIYVTLSHTKKVFANIKRRGKDFSGRDTPLFPTMIVQAQEQVDEEPMVDETKNVESVSTHSNGPLLSGEDRLKLNELMELYTSLSQRVLDLAKTKTSQAIEITESAQVVSSKDEGLGDQEDASKQGRKLADIDADVEDVVEKEVSTAKVATDNTTKTIVDELTLAQTLIEIKAAKPKAVATAATTTTTVVKRPKARWVVVQEPSEFTTTTSPSQPSQLPQAKGKGKAKMVEPEKPLKKKDQIMFDKEVAQKLQAQLDAELEEEEKLARQRKEDANIAEWDNVQAMTDANYELALVKSIETRTEGSSKRAGEELEFENSKKQKLDKNVEAEVNDEAEMKKHIEIVLDDEVAIDAIHLATKPPIIID